MYCYTGDYQYRLPQFVARNEIDIDPAIDTGVVSVSPSSSRDVDDAWIGAAISKTDSVQEKARGEAHLHLCTLADKLEIELLKNLASREFLEKKLWTAKPD